MKLNKRFVTLGLLILILSVALKFIWTGLKQIKVDDFHPAAVIFVIDSSASNQKRLPEQKKILRQICNLLDPEDQIKILRVSEDAYLIYEGGPMNGSTITKSMDAFTKYDQKDYGTAYGVGLKKAFSHALTMKKNGYIPAVEYGIKAPFDVPSENFMAIKLNDTSEDVQGIVKYAKEFGI